MPRALLLARHFPPIGGAGVHRTVGSVRYLPSFGYEPILVTGPGLESEPHNRWEPRDPGMLDAVPAGTAIHRIPGPEPAGGGSRQERLLARWAPWVHHWLEHATRIGIAKGRDADVIIASGVPYETTFAGAAVAARLGRPWIADLEDPWALDEMRIPVSLAHKALDMRRMRRALSTASAVIMAAPEAAERLRRAMPELASRITITGIPIGYEPEDFPASAPAAPDGVFRIVHTGSMHTDLGRRLQAGSRFNALRGVHRGLDVLTRSHVFLVEAIARLLAAEPALEQRVELHLAGDLTAADRDVIAGHDFVRPAGLLPHERTVALMRSADLLFLPMQNLPPGTRAGLIPYKTFEYLAARRPILAAVPDGDVRDMLSPLAQAAVVRPDDVPAMQAAIRRRVREAAQSPGGREPDTAPPVEYERRRCVERIAAVLDAVTER